MSGEDQRVDGRRRGHRIFRRRELVVVLVVLLGALCTTVRQDEGVDESLLFSVSRGLAESRRLCHGEGFREESVGEGEGGDEGKK